MKRGRKSKYEEDQQFYNQMAKQHARDGKIDEEIAKALGIAKSTLNEWKKKYPEFSDSLKTGKEYADSLVEDSLFKRANGFEYEETEIIADKKGDITKPVRIKKIKKHALPDVTAQIFWLKNRQPEKWRDKKEIEHGGEMTHKNEYSYLTEEELDNELKQYEDSD